MWFTLGENELTVNEGVFTDDIHPNGDGPVNVSGSGLTATTLKATGIVDGGLVSASSTPALVLTGDLQLNMSIHSSGTITALFGTANSVELTAEAETRETDDTAEAMARGTADTTLQGNIDAEAMARGTADTALQANINQVTNFLQGAPTTTLV